ncbi:hypothetical protein [Nonomuraea sp. NPDC049129]|uniref:hypothetical protein n=1 Tax=Nonomuraea sp. NPDC049129 TaxID=3155272 RepID=UPI0033CB72EF
MSTFVTPAVRKTPATIVPASGQKTATVATPVMLLVTVSAAVSAPAAASRPSSPAAATAQLSISDVRQPLLRKPPQAFQNHQSQALPPALPFLQHLRRIEISSAPVDPSVVWAASG